MKPAAPTVPLTDEQRQLIEDNLHIPRQIARARCRGRSWRLADCEAAAIDGLIRAAQEWCPDRGEFAMYAKNLCGFAIQEGDRQRLRQVTGSRKPGKGINVGSLDKVRVEAEDCRADFSMHNMLSRPDDTLAVDDADEAEGILRKLPEGLPRRIMRLFVLEGLQASEVAEKIGMTDVVALTNTIRWCFARLRESMQAA